MAHRIIGYYTLEQIGKILNKWFYFYYKSQYCWLGIEITDISSTEADAKFAVCVVNDNGNYALSMITSARTAFDITYRGVHKYDSYPYGNTVDPPKDPNSTWVSVVNLEPQTVTVTPYSPDAGLYPYTDMIFSGGTITASSYAYADSDGCVRIWDDNGILNDWDTSIAYSSTNFKSYVREIMGHPAIPPRGQGTVTLDIPANGANLTFESALLGVSVTKMISGDAVVDIEEPPSTDLVIFESGSFSNVISGFDIANYKSCGEDSISSLSAYYNTSWGLYKKQQNALPFVVENGLIVKTMQSVIGATSGIYFIPINRASGFTKIHVRTKLQELQSSTIYNYSQTMGAAVVNNQMVYSSQEMDVFDNQVMADYILDISDLPYVDYIMLGGCDGKPVWEYIALEN